MYGSQVNSAKVSLLRATMCSSSSGIEVRSTGLLAGSWKRSRSSSSRGIANTSGTSSLSALPVLTPTGPISASRLIRSGTLVAISAAIQPPIEKPTRSVRASCMRSISSR